MRGVASARRRHPPSARALTQRRSRMPGRRRRRAVCWYASDSRAMHLIFRLTPSPRRQPRRQFFTERMLFITIRFTLRDEPRDAFWREE